MWGPSSVVERDGGEDTLKVYYLHVLLSDFSDVGDSGSGRDTRDGVGRR